MFCDDCWLKIGVDIRFSLFTASVLLFRFCREGNLDQAPNCLRAGGSVGLLFRPIVYCGPQRQRKSDRRYRILPSSRTAALFSYYGY